MPSLQVAVGEKGGGGLAYEVTGMSPQSMTVAQLLNGLASSGTLYPPLNRTLREPWGGGEEVSGRVGHVLEVEAARTLSDAAGAEAGTGAVGGAGVEGGS